jgi:hypothetical protein
MYRAASDACSESVVVVSEGISTVPDPSVLSGDRQDEWTGVLGATCVTGYFTLSRLADAGHRVLALSLTADEGAREDIIWRQTKHAALPHSASVPLWICLAPIWVLPDYFLLFEASGVRRLVAVSSTSRFTKSASSDAAERATVQRLIDGERCLQEWAESRGIEWVILRPTLIYGLGRDRNVSAVARFVRRFGFFPVLGAAAGLRQPLHADDLAAACTAALVSPAARNRAYNLSGGETLGYREMVRRICAACGRRPRTPTIPLWLFRLAVAILRHGLRRRQISAGMAERMNVDLVFDHSAASADLAFAPRAFRLEPQDLP